MLMRNQNLRFAAMLVAAGVSLGLGAAHAQSSPMASAPSAINATEGATTGLGTSHRFATTAAAPRIARTIRSSGPPAKS